MATLSLIVVEHAPHRRHGGLDEEIYLVLKLDNIGLGLGHTPVDLVLQLVQALVERIVAQYKLLQNLGRLLPELYAALRVNSITERNNDVEIEILHVTDDPANAFLPNCSNFLNSCRIVQFLRIEDVLQVIRYV